MNNKDVIGKVKDEWAGRPILEYVGLRPKMCSILESSWANIKKAKRVKQNVVKKVIRHEQFKECLFSDQIIRHGMYTLDFLWHQLYMDNIWIKSHCHHLTAKGFLPDNGIDTLTYGYWITFKHILLYIQRRQKIRVVGKQSDLLQPEINRVFENSFGFTMPD